MFKVILDKRVRDYVAKLDKKRKRQIAERIAALQSDPRPHDFIKLKGDIGYRIGVGEYRILYEIDDAQQLVTMYRVAHRKDVYRGL